MRFRNTGLHVGNRGGVPNTRTNKVNESRSLHARGFSLRFLDVVMFQTATRHDAFLFWGAKVGFQVLDDVE